MRSWGDSPVCLTSVPHDRLTSLNNSQPQLPTCHALLECLLRCPSTRKPASLMQHAPQATAVWRRAGRPRAARRACSASRRLPGARWLPPRGAAPAAPRPPAAPGPPAPAGSRAPAACTGTGRRGHGWGALGFAAGLSVGRPPVLLACWASSLPGPMAHLSPCCRSSTRSRRRGPPRPGAAVERVARTRT